MGVFHINVENLHWVDNETEDLCLHGDAHVTIGKEKLDYSDATVSATALYLLKSLSENHQLGQSNQFLPCCGHFMIADNTLSNVEIIGCSNGIDWSVFHENEYIKLITQQGMETCVLFEQYKNEVYHFADIIEEYYRLSAPKKLPKDEFTRNGYTAFWNEWHRRRKE